MPSPIPGQVGTDSRLLLDGPKTLRSCGAVERSTLRVERASEELLRLYPLVRGGRDTADLRAAREYVDIDAHSLVLLIAS